MNVVSKVYTPSMPGRRSSPRSVASFILLQERAIRDSDKQNSKKRIGLIVTRVFFGINQGIDLKILFARKVVIQL